MFASLKAKMSKVKMPEICIFSQEKHLPYSLSVILGSVLDLRITSTFVFSVRCFLSLHCELKVTVTMLLEVVRIISCILTHDNNVSGMAAKSRVLLNF